MWVAENQTDYQYEVLSREKSHNSTIKINEELKVSFNSNKEKIFWIAKKLNGKEQDAVIWDNFKLLTQLSEELRIISEQSVWDTVFSQIMNIKNYLDIMNHPCYLKNNEFERLIWTYSSSIWIIRVVDVVKDNVAKLQIVN